MLAGAYQAKKKNGEIYYRSNITYQNKHISLGSYQTEEAAHAAYLEAAGLLNDKQVSLEEARAREGLLKFDKIVSLINFRDNRIYFKTPIYLHVNYFSYYLSPTEEYKFDIDDLFFYSTHKILRRGGHLFVNEYGMQTSILSRYGIKSFAVAGKDYLFANGDATDFRYSNIIVVNRYYGVTSAVRKGRPCYETKLHINGNILVGVYASETDAAIAYNKARDYAAACGILKNFPENYIPELTSAEYFELYSAVALSRTFLNYIGL